MSNAPQFVTARPFEAGDLCRLVAWAGIATPEFLSNQDKIGSSERFIERASDEYTAVCYSNDSDCRTSGRLVVGPIAALRQTFGQRAEVVYVDPSMREDAVLARDIEKLISSSSQLRGSAPRLVAVA